MWQHPEYLANTKDLSMQTKPFYPFNNFEKTNNDITFRPKTNYDPRCFFFFFCLILTSMNAAIRFCACSVKMGLILPYLNYSLVIEGVPKAQIERSRFSSPDDVLLRMMCSNQARQLKISVTVCKYKEGLDHFEMLLLN